MLRRSTSHFHHFLSEFFTILPKFGQFLEESSKPALPFDSLLNDSKLLHVQKGVAANPAI